MGPAVPTSATMRLRAGTTSRRAVCAAGLGVAAAKTAAKTTSARRTAIPMRALFGRRAAKQPATGRSARRAHQRLRRKDPLVRGSGLGLDGDVRAADRLLDAPADLVRDLHPVVAGLE